MTGVFEVFHTSPHRDATTNAGIEVHCANGIRKIRFKMNVS
jgi:hypothetical protein